MSVGHPEWGKDGWARAQLMFSLLQGEPGMPGQSGTPGKEGLIGPKVWALSTMDKRGLKWGREGHGRVMGVSCQEGCGKLGHWGVE